MVSSPKVKKKKKKSDILAWNNTFGDKRVSSLNNVFSEEKIMWQNGFIAKS